MKRPRANVRPLAIGALSAALALAIGACGDDGDGAGKRGKEERLDLVIGNSVPLSGELADLGPAARKAGDLALTEIRDAIEAAGLRDSIRLLTEDNHTDRSKTMATIGRMADKGASCVVGPWSAPDTVTVARDLAIPRGIALISPAATLDEISTFDDRGLVSRTVPPDSYQGAALAKAIGDDLDGAKGKTVSVAARADAYGQAIAAAFERAWEEEGGEIGERVVYPPKPDFASVAERVMRSDADALVVIEFPRDFAELAGELERAGDYDPETTWGIDFLASTTLAEEIDDDELVDGLRGTVVGAPDDDPAAQAFSDLFEEAEPEDVERANYDAQTFDAVILCYLAALAAGSPDGAEIAARLPEVSGPPGETYTWEQLPEALEVLERGRQIDYQGAAGPLDLNVQGDPTSGVYDLYEFAEGKPRLVDEVSFNAAAGG